MTLYYKGSVKWYLSFRKLVWRVPDLFSVSIFRDNKKPQSQNFRALSDISNTCKMPHHIPEPHQ